MIVGCIQPSYVPWRGYFHLIQRSDVFVFHEDIQYTKQDWRNRNRVKTPAGVVWLTVPVREATSKGNISEVLIDNTRPWQAKHWRVIEHSYRRAPHFDRYSEFFRDVYNRRWEKLSDLDIYLTQEICTLLGVRTRFIRSPSLKIAGVKTERLTRMCSMLGADCYLSGPTARGYIDHAMLEGVGVRVEYMVYDYPEYRQLHGPFEPLVSVMDLLFNCGEEAPRYIWDRGAVS